MTASDISLLDVSQRNRETERFNILRIELQRAVQNVQWCFANGAVLV
jgi:hypothetical protein